MQTSQSSPKVLFFGTPEFASHILEHLIEHGVNIVGVVTTPDKPQGRGLKMRSSAVKLVAEKHAIPVMTPHKLRDPELPAQLAAFYADIFCVVAYKILPREIFTLPRLGSFNIHASLLPKYRGAAPINWAIIRGEQETGITTFLLDDKVDTGSMLLQERCDIGENETASELHDKLMAIGADLGLRTIRGLAAGDLIPQAQADTEATTAPKIFPPDCVIEFLKPAEKVHDLIRGLSSYPAATTVSPLGVKLKILRTVIASSEPALQPGEYHILDNKRLFVGTLTAPLEVLRLQREGKNPMSTEEFLRGSKALFIRS
jgi:methionyl-tRNA formyltransferase